MRMADKTKVTLIITSISIKVKADFVEAVIPYLIIIYPGKIELKKLKYSFKSSSPKKNTIVTPKAIKGPKGR